MSYTVPPFAAAAVRKFMSDNAGLHEVWLARLHSLAELSFQEVETSRFVAETLAEHCPSLSVTHGLLPALPTAVIAVYDPPVTHFSSAERSSSGSTILLRADIDALPIRPTNSSVHLHPEVHHACGHDGHAACLLACAHYLEHCTPTDCKRIVLLWQPAEESGGGARVLVEKCGLFETLHADVSSVFALHSWPSKPLGHIFVGVGPVMAESGTFQIEIVGSG
jgi:amidohydrolase